MLQFFRQLLPQRHRREMQYIPEGWSDEHAVRGWDVDSVLRKQLAQLDQLKSTLASKRALSNDVHSHNAYTTFAYVAALAAGSRQRLSLLDWGGGVGQYRLIAQATLPDVCLDYYCKEVSVQCDAGRQVLPDATFFRSDEEFADRTFDLVIASGALQYVRNWQEVLKRLIQATGRYLFITRLPITTDSDSYVWLHRPYSVGYGTEYLGWCLNQDEFLVKVQQLGATLVREFHCGEKYRIYGAPGACEGRGFLFQKQ